MINKKIQKFIIYWFPVFVWASVIFFFSTLQMTGTTEIHWQDFIVKKTAHVIEYAVLSVLLYRGLNAYEVETKNAGIIAIIISVIYGMSDEWHQSFTPGREPRIRDVGFDTIGATLAIYGIWNFLPKAPKKLRNWAKKLQIL